jgi:hypothetical protein
MFNKREWLKASGKKCIYFYEYVDEQIEGNHLEPVYITFPTQRHNGFPELILSFLSLLLKQPPLVMPREVSHRFF